MKKYLSCYHSAFATSLVYMLQSNEYNVDEYLAWFWRAPDLRRVAHRGRLILTAKARLLRLFTRALIVAEAAAIASLLWVSQPLAAIVLLLAAPLLTVYALALVLKLGEWLIQGPREGAVIAATVAAIPKHPGYRIAIAGSFGKTTVKEILLTVLSAGKTVAATPGNMNTPLGISRFVKRLTGKEGILIFELGEYYPRDIEKLCRLVRPQLGVITGINEAHLSKFKTLERTTATIFELADALPEGPVYKNGESALVAGRATKTDPLLYTQSGVNGWHITHAHTTLTGTSFTAKKGSKTVQAQSGLLGLHQIGPLAAAIDIADRLGLTPAQIETGLSHTQPFEHRMQPRALAGATIVDDTYNGNSEGVKVGLTWLAAVPATRRIYVTPGLVEQGSSTAAVHEHIGRQIAPVADVVVLMQNSVTPFIQRGLEAAHFTGQLQIVAQPTKFYTHLDQFVAAGDVVLMQNDWPDNYA